ncbi:MAG: response regulator [Gammaproteobacteria bacterium]|nr:response regulator [Gammaproteobacteria bacterium]
MARKALLVDDSKSARFVLGKLLEKHDFQVEMVASAEEALDLLEHQRPDVIFMDHLMKGMDGLIATSIIKKNSATAHIPIVMCTSNDGEAYLNEAKSLGALGTLVKPPSAEKLAEILIAIDKAIDNNRSVGETPPGRVTPAAPATPAAAPALSLEEIEAQVEATVNSLLNTRLELIEASVEAQLAEQRKETGKLIADALGGQSGASPSLDEISGLLDERLADMSQLVADQLDETRTRLSEEILASAKLARLVQDVATESAVPAAEERAALIAKSAAQSSAQELINPALDVKVGQQLNEVKRWAKTQALVYALFAACVGAGVALTLHFIG